MPKDTSSGQQPQNPTKNITTWRQLTAYIYEHVSSGAWGGCMLPNFDHASRWSDEPVSQREVNAEIRAWQRSCRGSAE